MVRVELGVAEHFLKRSVFVYYPELCRLQYYQSLGETSVRRFALEAFASTQVADGIALVSIAPPLENVRDEAAYHVMLCGRGELFLADCLQWLRDAYSSFGVVITDPEGEWVVRQLAEDFSLRGERRWYRYFVCTLPARQSAPAVGVARLTAAEREAAERYPQDQLERLEWNLTAAFQHSVVEGRGEIFAVWDGGQIAGFLDARPGLKYLNIWDVDSFHVREEMRRRGYGCQLAAGYARAMLTSGRIPYYSNALNAASEHTAERAGFTCCRQQLYLDARRA